MAVKWIGANWKAQFANSKVTSTADERVYLDFRQKLYPPLATVKTVYVTVTDGIKLGDESTST